MNGEDEWRGGGSSGRKQSGVENEEWKTTWGRGGGVGKKKKGERRSMRRRVNGA